MPPLGPIGRRKLAATFVRLGFEGPYSGGKHEFMVQGEGTASMPTPHRGYIEVGLLKRILRQAGIGRAEWEEA